MGDRALFGGAVMRILRINHRPDFDDLIFTMSDIEESVTTSVRLVIMHSTQPTAGRSMGGWESFRSSSMKSYGALERVS